MTADDEALAYAVAALITRNRQPWWADALCREYPDVEFFPGLGESTAPAKAVCAGCLVRSECHAEGVELDHAGVWGGSSQPERRKLRSTAA